PVAGPPSLCAGGWPVKAANDAVARRLSAELVAWVLIRVFEISGQRGRRDLLLDLQADASPIVRQGRHVAGRRGGGGYGGAEGPAVPAVADRSLWAGDPAELAQFGLRPFRV